MASPICTVNTLSTVNGVALNGGDDVNIALADTAGVKMWVLTCIATDGGVDPNTVSGNLAVNQTSKTATLGGGMPDIGGVTLIFQSYITLTSGGPAQVTTFEVHVVILNSSLRYIALNETFEGNSAVGWLRKLNDCIEQQAVSATMLNGGTNVANPSSLAMRDSSGGDQFVYVQIGAANANYASAGGVRFAKPSSIKVRNNANSADISLVASDNTDNVTIGDTNAATLTLKSAGAISLAPGGGTTAAQLDASGNVLLWGGAGLGSGAHVVSGANATTAPTTNPSGGGEYYWQNGALKHRGPNGTVVTIGPA